MCAIFSSGSNAVPDNSGSLAQSESSDLNVTSDSINRAISTMSKKNDCHSKENIVPTYPDGSINYDGIIFSILYNT